MIQPLLATLFLEKVHIKDRSSVTATERHRANAYLIFENSLNLQKIEIRDRVEDGDGKSHYVLNPKETQYARSKQEELQEIFKNWVMNHSQVLEELQGIYEERFNRLVPRAYDGSYLEFEGAE